MNVDSLARLIESADIATLRTIAVDFLPLMGFDDAFFSDGPYDGGLDFVVRTQRVNGQRIGFQLSVEKDWRKKIKGDADKAKIKHETNSLYFISTRRIPEGSWVSVQAGVAKETGVNIFKYDNQVMATVFIRTNSVARLLEIFEIPMQDDKNEIEFLVPKNEAIASLLVFGSDAKDFRESMIDSMIKATLSQAGELIRDDLIQKVAMSLSMTNAQGVVVNAGIDRLLQGQSLVSNNKRLALSAVEKSAFMGLRAASEFELAELQNAIREHLEGVAYNESEQKLILRNLFALISALVSDSFHLPGAQGRRDEVYQEILNTLASRVGEQDAVASFATLATIVANSQFGKRIASVQLYQCILESNSRLLTAALGGSRGLSIFFDTSVFIPMICGALFDPGRDRFGKSAADLFELLKDHEFLPILPSIYLEEVAAHLVSACRDYRYLLEQDIDIERSTNAFVSHFSSLKNISGYEALTFSSYVGVFGISLETISETVADAEFYRLRDRAIGEIRRIARKYGFEVKACEGQYFGRVQDRIREAMGSAVNSRAPLLIEHDSKVISFLEEQVSSTDDVMVLCTWDRIHADLNPAGEAGYFVMSPVALIDFLAIGKRGDDYARVSTLSNFADAISESQIVASAHIWDAIARISGSQLSDGEAITSARNFREKYLNEHASLGLVGEDDIAKSWIAWRNAKARV